MADLLQQSAKSHLRKDTGAPPSTHEVISRLLSASNAMTYQVRL